MNSIIKTMLTKVSRILPDKIYLKVMFYKHLHKKLSFNNPKTFNEKLQWLKIYNRRPEYAMMVDKYEVRKYIAEKVGGKYLVPLVGMWEEVDDIDFDSLPRQFVLKCTHDSGSVIVCKDKDIFDVETAKKKLNGCMQRNPFWYGREWPYKNVKPRMIAEKYLEDEVEVGLKDFKVFCFGGKAKLIVVCRGRFYTQTQDTYDTDWNKTPITQGYPGADYIMERPAFLEEMLRLSELLAQGLIHIRVDWYYANNQLYFGELTFTDGCGFLGFDNEEYDYMIGDWMELPKIEQQNEYAMFN